ncbi:histone-fold-containing protein [Lactifluus volemus]|nr:histone-fold-containing protein [Lactifluus volemus]
MKNRNKTTKFPVARIKKIMQKDEEVGKVAQATPIVISKALELFLQLVVDEASRVTIARGSKKVEAYHLKHAIETTEMLDFLKELVEGIQTHLPVGKKAAASATDDADDDGGRAAPTKRRRRKKKEEAPEVDNSAVNGEGDETMQDVAPPTEGMRTGTWTTRVAGIDNDRPCARPPPLPAC